MKNKIFSFVLDLFKNGDKEERAGIFAQVKIYRSTSARVFEIIVGILVLAMWLLTIRNIIHSTSDDLPYLLLFHHQEQTLIIYLTFQQQYNLLLLLL